MKVAPLTPTSIIGLVVEFVVAIDEARVRFTDDAHIFLPLIVISSFVLTGSRRTFFLPSLTLAYGGVPCCYDF